MREDATAYAVPAKGKSLGRLHRVPASFAVCLLLALLGGVVTVVWQAESRENAMVNALQSILSWPAVTLALGLFIALRFESGFSALLRSLATRAWKGKIGPAELAADAVGQPAGTDVPPPDDPGEEVSPDERGRRADGGDRGIGPAGGEETDTSAAQVAKVQSQTWFWYLEYLAQFLRPHTQSILAFFGVIPVPIMVGSVTTLILPSHPTEQTNVMRTLFQNGLLQRQGDEITVTDQGRRFLEHQRTMGRAVSPNANPFAGFPPEPVFPDASGQSDQN